MKTVEMTEEQYQDYINNYLPQNKTVCETKKEMYPYFITYEVRTNDCYTKMVRQCLFEIPSPKCDNVHYKKLYDKLGQHYTNATWLCITGIQPLF